MTGNRRRWWRRALLLLILLGLLAFAVLEGIVLSGAKTDLRQEPDVMIVLGAQVKDTGPSSLLEDRLKTAMDYLAEHPELPVVVSGGQGKDEPTTEARCMYDYLVDGGIAPERIWMEERSHNTSQNFAFTKALLAEKGMDVSNLHVLVVSNDFHLARAGMLAKRQGFDASVLAAPSSQLAPRVQSYIREAPALVKSFLFDW